MFTGERGGSDIAGSGSTCAQSAETAAFAGSQSLRKLELEMESGASSH
jgi:hypothetical protein